MYEHVGGKLKGHKFQHLLGNLAAHFGLQCF